MGGTSIKRGLVDLPANVELVDPAPLDAWNDARESTGLHAVRLHDLRHLGGTITAQTGATLKEIMERLGHSTVGAALRYQHVAENRAAEIASRLDVKLSNELGHVEGTSSDPGRAGHPPKST